MARDPRTESVRRDGETGGGGRRAWRAGERRGGAFVVMVAAGSLVVCSAAVGGCALPQLIGGMAESARLTGSTTVPAEYEGLRGRTWAVVTLAPRGVRAEVPNVIEVLTNATTRKLVEAQNDGALASAGFQPPAGTLLLQRTDPSFSAWSYAKMADELGVERLIVIDINHMQLYERGNKHLWDGAIAGRLGVVETDSGGSDFAYQRDLAIGYPDGSGYSTDELSKPQIVNTLLDRMSNRVAWTFFEHDEPNTIEY